MSFYNFKRIQVIPTSNDFIDIVLSKTQRKTPTVVHKHYQISRIRSFYMRKVKFAQDCFDEKLAQILGDFPKLDEIHPFYADLINVLYDRDHYKLALGQLNTAKHLIDNIGRDYARLLKFGDSLYRCKQLKKAALGRMATIMKRHKDTLAYLEQVRQHLSRMPSIDPNTRTLLVCGYPNVGKSSFVNKLSRADVEVQPYAFTTKSLFVGHMDYKYLRWQVIDTPGILDHPLEDRNTIEMLSITALAHLRACILYFMDLSEQCGYSIADQAKLFHSIKPLFTNKPLVLVINKIDARKPADLSPEEKAILDGMISPDMQVVEMSCFTEDGVMNTRNAACDKLLSTRVENKMRGNKVNDILHRIHVAQPQERDEKTRTPFIPEAVKNRIKLDVHDPSRPKLERDIELENGGAGVYNINLKKKYILEKEEWKNDVIPEIMDGHNVADFIDPDIAERLDALEREEEALVSKGAYKVEEPVLDEDTLRLRKLANKIIEKKKLMIQAHRMAKGKNRPTLPHKVKAKMASLSDMSNKLSSIGLDTSKVESNEAIRVGRKRSRSMAPNADAMDLDQHPSKSKEPRPFSSTGVSRCRSTSRVTRDRSQAGLRNMEQKLESERMFKKALRPSNSEGRKGVADRVVTTSRPKHLFSGKRSNGTASHR